MRILLLEDDSELAEVLLLGLRNAAYATDHAPNRATAEELLLTTGYDVACIDLGLPDGDGLDLISEIGRGALFERPKRIIITTARDAVAQRVAGLDAGADDYLVKPFAFDELLARIRAVNRREDQFGAELIAGDLVLDPAALTARRAGRDLGLTAREFALLRYLMTRAGEVLPAEHLIEHVWDASADPFSTSVRVIMSRLRQKLGSPGIIHTVPGLGYRLEVDG